jgi:transcriptional regulator GlxA family with amidase domain
MMFPSISFWKIRTADFTLGIDILQYLRLGEAREKLEFSSLPINEIFCWVGYEDPGAFRKVFQRTMGLSPGEYRRRFGFADAE